jgi:quercetin dioxygenase-like cupin family protein
VLPDGTKEQILEVADESRHHLVLSNEYTRVLKVEFPPNDTTLAHRHAEDSLYFFLVEGGLQVVNHVKGSDPVCDCMDFGEVRYGTHR